MLSEQKIEEYRRNLSSGGWLQGLLFSRLLKQIDELAEDDSPLAVAVLAETIAAINNSPKIQATAWQALDQLHTLGPDHLCQLARVYCHSGEPLLAELIVRHRWLPLSPPELRVETALKTGLIKPLYDDGPETVTALLKIVQGEDKAKMQLAETVLLNLTKITARDELCRLASEEGQPEALRVALTAGYLPNNIGARSLFFFLNDQFDKYDELDFDRYWLKTYYQTGSDGLCRRITQKVREAGRVDYLDIIRTNPIHSEVKAKTDWAVTIEVLKQQERWPDLWALVREAPPRWCKQILQDWPSSAWQPADSTFALLRQLSRQCGSVHVPLGHLYNPPYVLELTSYFSTPSTASAYFNQDGSWLYADSPNGGQGPQRFAEYQNEEPVSPDPLQSRCKLFELKSNSKAGSRVQVGQPIPFSKDVTTLGNLFEITENEDFQIIKTVKGQLVGILRRNNGFWCDAGRDYAAGADNQLLLFKRRVKNLGMWDFKLYNLNTNKFITTIPLPAINSSFKSNSSDKAATPRLSIEETVAVLFGTRLAFNEVTGQIICLIEGQALHSYDPANAAWQLIMTSDKENAALIRCFAVDTQFKQLAVGLHTQFSTPGLLVLDASTNQIKCSYQELHRPTLLRFSSDGQTLVGLYSSPSNPTDEQLEPNWIINLTSLSDGQKATLRINLSGENRVWDMTLTEQGNLMLVYKENQTQTRLRVYEFWLVGLIGREQTTITLADWLKVQAALAGGAEMLPSERHWLEFCETLLRWNHRHEVELDDKPPTTPQEFDIEL